MNYVIITPARDEEKYIEETLRSVAAQTIRPSQWVMVDDGSQDRTGEIIDAAAVEHSWILPLHRGDRGSRQPGGGVIEAFHYGYDRLTWWDWQFVVKLDCDLVLPRDYFELLIYEFRKDPGLGIASGVYSERSGGKWVPVAMPEYHAAGASKILRRDCFDEIGGFVACAGWDTVDEIRAQVKGWRTRHFKNIEVHHLKKEGQGIGSVRTNLMHGEIYYLSGGAWGFLGFKLLHRLLKGHPVFVGGLAMLWGYLRCWTRRRPRLVTPQEARFYRQMLNRRIARHLGQLFGGVKSPSKAWS